MKKVKKLILLLITIIFMCSISTINYASDVGDIFNIPVVNNTTKPTNNTTVTNNSVANNTNTSLNKSVNNTNTSLPKTGVNDSAMWVLIGACAIAAIYTYKKVRDYDV